MKLIVELNNLSMIKELKKFSLVEFVEIGIKDFSFCPALDIELDEVSLVIDNIIKNGLKVIINFQRVYTDIELDRIKEIILSFPLDKIAYFSYSDLGFNSLLYSLNLGDKLLFRSPTYLTNTYDIDLYGKYNKLVTVSSEISSSELLFIAKHSKSELVVDCFGQNAIFHSRRELLKNFFLYRKLNLDCYKDNYYLIEELREDKYPIREYHDCTVVFEPKHYFLDRELIELNELDNVILGYIHTINLTKVDTLKIVKLINDYLCDPSVDITSTLECVKAECYKGAYDKTSYLLKKEANSNA